MEHIDTARALHGAHKLPGGRLGHHAGNGGLAAACGRHVRIVRKGYGGQRSEHGTFQLLGLIHVLGFRGLLSQHIGFFLLHHERCQDALHFGVVPRHITALVCFRDSHDNKVVTVFATFVNLGNVARFGFVESPFHGVFRISHTADVVVRLIKRVQLADEIAVLPGVFLNRRQRLVFAHKAVKLVESVLISLRREIYRALHNGNVVLRVDSLALNDLDDPATVIRRDHPRFARRHRVHCVVHKAGFFVVKLAFKHVRREPYGVLCVCILLGKFCKVGAAVQCVGNAVCAFLGGFRRGAAAGNDAAKHGVGGLNFGNELHDVQRVVRTVVVRRFR